MEVARFRCIADTYFSDDGSVGVARCGRGAQSIHDNFIDASADDTGTYHADAEGLVVGGHGCFINLVGWVIDAEAGGRAAAIAILISLIFLLSLFSTISRDCHTCLYVKTSKDTNPSPPLEINAECRQN